MSEKAFQEQPFGGDSSERETKPFMSKNKEGLSPSTRRPDGTHRVVVTGMGAISPAGIGVEALWDCLKAKKCLIDEIDRFDTEGFEISIAAQIPGYDALEAGFSKKEARRFARFVQYAIVASDEAMAQAAIDFENEDRGRFGCLFGSGIGGLEEFESGCNTLLEKGPKRLNPLFIPTMISNMAAGILSIRYGLEGECVELVSACATGAHNIGSAFRSIKHGYLDAALAGGTEESITPVCIAGFTNLGALAKEKNPSRASLPFDVRRKGFVAGEGAGAVVLESLEHALDRGATILGEIAGFGSTGDAYHMTAPQPEGDGLVRAMRQALEEANYQPEDIGHVNAHGTATPANDKTEATALRSLCGDAIDEIPVVSIKGSIGHTLGAAGALEAITAFISLERDVVLPTTGFEEPDPECRLRILTEPLTHHIQKLALSNSLGFGGHNASLAILPYRD